MQGSHSRSSTMLRQKHLSVLEFIKTLKLDPSRKLILVAKTLADTALPPPKWVEHNVNARMVTLIQGYNNENLVHFLSGNSYNTAGQ